MTLLSSHPSDVSPDSEGVTETVGRARWLTRLKEALGFENIGAVYVLALIVLVFSIWIPDIFLSTLTAKQIVNSSAVTALAALSIVVPLATATFDLSIGFTMSLAGVTAAYFAARTDIGVPASMLMALAVAALVGLINGFVVVVMRVDSFIATLASGSLIMSFITMVTDQNPITDVKLAGSFSAFAQRDYGGVIGPVIYALILAMALWFLLQRMVIGRHMYAAGFNPNAARLGGIRVERLRFLALVISSILAGFAGIVLASTISSGGPSAGSTYLLPAFAAAFVGATQFQKGRFNAWGTMVAVLLLGTGTTGLSLAQAPPWAGDLFTGIVLIAALALTGAERRAATRGTGRLLGRLRRTTDAKAVT